LPAVVADALPRTLRPDTRARIVRRARQPVSARALWRADLRSPYALRGLPDSTTSHDLRHPFASARLAAGESVVAVAERLGLPEIEEAVRTLAGDIFPRAIPQYHRSLRVTLACLASGVIQ
jgi:hypothetical protein